MTIKEEVHAQLDQLISLRARLFAVEHNVPDQEGFLREDLLDLIDAAEKRLMRWAKIAAEPQDQD